MRRAAGATRRAWDGPSDVPRHWDAAVGAKSAARARHVSWRRMRSGWGGWWARLRPPSATAVPPPVVGCGFVPGTVPHVIAAQSAVISIPRWASRAQSPQYMRRMCSQAPHAAPGRAREGRFGPCLHPTTARPVAPTAARAATCNARWARPGFEAPVTAQALRSTYSPLSLLRAYAIAAWDRGAPGWRFDQVETLAVTMMIASDRERRDWGVGVPNQARHTLPVVFVRRAL